MIFLGPLHMGNWCCRHFLGKAKKPSVLLDARRIKFERMGRTWHFYSRRGNWARVCVLVSHTAQRATEDINFFNWLPRVPLLWIHLNKMWAAFHPASQYQICMYGTTLNPRGTETRAAAACIATDEIEQRPKMRLEWAPLTLRDISGGGQREGVSTLFSGKKDRAARMTGIFRPARPVWCTHTCTFYYNVSPFFCVCANWVLFKTRHYQPLFLIARRHKRSSLSQPVAISILGRPGVHKCMHVSVSIFIHSCTC